MNKMAIPSAHKNFSIQFDESYNPTISCPESLYNIHFFFTDDDSHNVEDYKSMIVNAVSIFRSSRLYKMYKGFLIDLGLDQCQLLPGVNVDIGDKGDNFVEMHHNFLTIFDVAILIAGHKLENEGYISTFDLVHELKEVHRSSMVPIVMLSKTPHQMFHANEDFMLPAQITFGFWQELLNNYKDGLTEEIMRKVTIFLQRSQEYQQTHADFTNSLLELREEGMKDWSKHNGIKSDDRLRISSIESNGSYYYDA